jgi:hypothetical protein
MVDFESFPAGDLEPTGVETKLSEDGCVDVSDVVSIFRGMKAKLIGGSHTTPPLMPPPAIQTLNPKM